MKTETFSQNISRVSDLKVGIRELPFPFIPSIGKVPQARLVILAKI